MEGIRALFNIHGQWWGTLDLEYFRKLTKKLKLMCFEAKWILTYAAYLIKVLRVWVIWLKDCIISLNLSMQV